MERYCSTGQSPERAVAPTEEEEKEEECTLTNSMKQIPSLEANTSSAHQEIPRILWN
jgi:hypothetical protein